MAFSIDMTQIIEFLIGLLNTPSPSGYSEDAIQYVQRAISNLDWPGIQIERNVKGALIVSIPGESEIAPRAISAHVDTLGAMVREIKANGRLMLTQVGGYAWQSVESENVIVHAVNVNKTYSGTIQTINPSLHTSSEVSEGKRDAERMEVRLDARVSSKEDTRALGIEVGDFVSFDPRVVVTPTGFVKSRHLDDKASVAVVYGALVALRNMDLKPAQWTTILMSNYEEVGHGASTGIPADVVELLAIDMGAATTGEHQNSDEYSVNICAKDSSGPYDLRMRQRLVRLCRDRGIPYRLDTYPHYGSDGSAFLRAGGDVRVGLIGPGVDASHAYERTHTDSIEASIQLTLEYLLDP